MNYEAIYLWMVIGTLGGAFLLVARVVLIGVISAFYQADAALRDDGDTSPSISDKMVIAAFSTHAHRYCDEENSRYRDQQTLRA